MAEDIYAKYNIDISKLKRDYIKNPIHISKNGIGSEKPYKEDLEYLYIILNIRLNDLLLYFNVNEGTFLRWEKNYNIKKSRKSINKNIVSFFKNNFNCSNCFQIKNIIEKSKQTKIEKYGNENYNNRKKYKKTCLEKYGCNCSLGCKEIRIKGKNTKLEKYGNENYTNRIKALETCKRKGKKNCISKAETLWLDTLNIPNDNDHRQVYININGKSYIVDGFDPKTNTVYEFLGDYWHGNPKKFLGESINPSCYKTFKQLYDETINKLNDIKSKYNLIYIWESDFKK